jgi:hypothetical protein
VSVPGTRVVEGELHRVRRGRRKSFVAAPPSGPLRRPARVAVSLAFAHRIRQAIESGELKDQADAARTFGFTRARLSQILDLANLAPDLQEGILFLEVVDGREPLRERALRGVVRVAAWAGQRAVLRVPRVDTPFSVPPATTSSLPPRSTDRQVP